MSFVDIYMEKYYDRLNNEKDQRFRGEGFRVIFEYLQDELSKLEQLEGLLLVETGSCRKGYSLEGDGQCTFLLDQFVQWANSTKMKPFGKNRVFSIDIDTATTEWCHNNTSENVTCINDDSIHWLWHFNKTPNFIYLDSHDISFHDPTPSSIHHLKELACVTRLLGLPHNHRMMICVDDCWFNDNDPRIPKSIKPSDVGKGRLIKEFFNTISILPVHDSYQLIYII